TKLAELIKEEEDLAAVEEVIKMIFELPSVKQLELADREQVEAARAAYENLSSEQKELVTNLDLLESLEAKLVELEEIAADMEAAMKVEEIIASLPGLSELELSDRDLVEEARAAFEKLTDTQKEYVANLILLEALEDKLVELEEKAAVDQAAAEEVQSLIDSLPAIEDLTLEAHELVEAAREAYVNLTNNQKELVTNLEKLEQAEEKL